MSSLYNRSDKYIEKLKKKIRIEFNKLAVTSFDELNVVKTREKTSEMYDRFMDFNEKEYKSIIRDGIEYTRNTLAPTEQQKVDDSEDLNDVVLLGVLLLSYNSLTGYLYKNEADRKRMRLNEEILSAREFSNRQGYHDALRRSANLWFTQSMEYGDMAAFLAEKETYKAAGITKVRWVTEQDEKVCKYCQEREGQVYKIDDAPGLLHYHCRCHYEPYRENNER